MYYTVLITYYGLCYVLHSYITAYVMYYTAHVIYYAACVVCIS